MGEKMQLLIHSARQIVQVCANGELFLSGPQMKSSFRVLTPKTPDDGLAIVADKDGRIVAVGPNSEVLNKFRNTKFERTVDASDLCILPGFIDAHTHPVWAGDRVHEYRMKLAGASYMSIHKAGGGIHYTVDHTRRASEHELYALLRDRLLRVVRSGTTVVEAKSGYGLNVETELKMLRVLERGKRELSSFIDISITFCGAHAIPKGLTEESATRAVIEEQLPAVARSIRLGEISVDNIDVFCEKDVFEVESSRRILEAGREMGFRLNFHADELNPIGGAEMGVALKADAMSHLEHISDAAIQGMAENALAAVILPSTAHILRLQPPPVRKMIEAGVPVALGSDFNPNAFCLSMPVVMQLACTICHMSMEEAIVAATLNAAYSLGLSSKFGSIEVGKNADLVLLDAPTWEHLVYEHGEHHNLIQMVIKNGFVAYEKVPSQ